MEVKLGELAGRNGSSFRGERIWRTHGRDHTRLHKELGATATSIGLTVPTDLSEDQRTEYTKLSENVRKEVRQGVYRLDGEGSHRRSCCLSEDRTSANQDSATIIWLACSSSIV